VKNPAPRITYENTEATTMNAMSTIAASRPVNPFSLLYPLLIEPPEINIRVME